MLDDYSRKNLKNLSDSSAVTEAIFEAAQDTTTGSLSIIDIAHTLIHNGRHFVIQDYKLSLGNGASYEFVFTTPDTLRRIHWNYEIDIEDDASVVIKEDVTASGGTSITPVNNNRNSGNASTMTVVHTPSSVSGGTVIAQQRKGLGAGINVIGGVVRSDGEIVFKQNTKYSVKITNNAATAKKVNWTFFWYENLV